MRIEGDRGSGVQYTIRSLAISLAKLQIARLSLEGSAGHAILQFDQSKLSEVFSKINGINQTLGIAESSGTIRELQRH